MEILGWLSLLSESESGSESESWRWLVLGRKECPKSMMLLSASLFMTSYMSLAESTLRSWPSSA